MIALYWTHCTIFNCVRLLAPMTFSCWSAINQPFRYYFATYKAQFKWWRALCLWHFEWRGVSLELRTEMFLLMAEYSIECTIQDPVVTGHIDPVTVWEIAFPLWNSYSTTLQFLLTWLGSVFILSQLPWIIIIIIIVYRPLSMPRTGWTFSPIQAPPTRSLLCPFFLSLVQETLSL